MTFTPPDDWIRIRTLDAHAAGEPLRVVVEGYPDLPGATILARRRYAREHLDHLRRTLVLEPRGHADMYACIPTPPATPDGDVGVLFLHNEGYSTMCGHGIIGLVTVGLEADLLSHQDTIRIDTPAGRVEARAEVKGGRVCSVTFRNVPSFLLERDLEIDVPGIGKVTTDIAYGGAFYALVDAEPLGVELTPENFAHIVDIGVRIKRAVMASYEIHHPAGDADLDFLYGTILVAPSPSGHHSRNVCIFADGEVDRSPTGTGVSSRAAALVTRGELAIGETITIESLIGTTFDVTPVEETRAGSLPAIAPEVRGSAWLTGQHEFWVDPSDPLREGVLLR